MVVKKTLGFILAILGVIGLAAWAIPSFNAYAEGFVQGWTGNDQATLNDNILLAISAVAALVGVFLITKGSAGKKEKEVPIYQGKNVVGYRRR
ncbi:MAG: hypothetical protein KJ718_00435 [Nanoarchaeota archaeon]|nr:hypothetical protein [Nanoarchaeota archaeon]MBU1051008.1 hypothetical protein [Nanoarchaeota archaeon]MBU1989049.1 hypothetical protein [Nanoarchaeota archaeon]